MNTLYLLIMFSLYGQISHAKVNLLEVRPGKSESLIEISGNPQQTSAPILYAVLDLPPTFANNSSTVPLLLLFDFDFLEQKQIP